MKASDTFDRLVASHIREVPAVGTYYLRSFLEEGQEELFRRTFACLVEGQGRQGAVNPDSGARLFKLLSQKGEGKAACKKRRAEIEAILKPLHIHAWEVTVGLGENKAHHRHGRRRVKGSPFV